MINFIKQRLHESLVKLKEEEDYRGGHTAPDKEYGAPMFDVNSNDIYPEDIYGPNGARYYGEGNTSMDNTSIYLIQTARNKPNQSVKIYRAVPDFNKDTNKEIKKIKDIISFYFQHDFFPEKNPLVYSLQDKYPIDKYSIPEAKSLVLQDLRDKLAELESKLKKVTINNGDWVTINYQYAKEHGENALRGKYKILTKTTQARNLYTDGNSIHEWGYWK